MIYFNLYKEIIYFFLFIVVSLITIIIHELGHAQAYKNIIKKNSIIFRMKIGLGKALFKLKIKNYYFYFCPIFFIMGIIYLSLNNLTNEEKIKVYYGGIKYNFYQMFRSIVLLIFFCKIYKK